MGALLKESRTPSEAVFARYLRRFQKEIFASDAFCILPWIHAHFFPTGKVYACCVAALEEMGDLRTHTFEEVWNSPAYKDLRLSMLKGKKSSVCNSCHVSEETHSQSARREVNDRFASHFSRVLETMPDGFYNKNTLPYLDVRFSNVCNFKCRTCDPNHSSMWNADIPKALGGGAPKVVKLSSLKNYPVDLINESLDVADEIYFAGGEPLLTKEHYEILNSLVKKNRTGVRLRYSSNLSVLHYGGQSIIDLWKHFSWVLVNVSIDGFGEHGEFVRHGLNWNQLRSNFFELGEKLPHVFFNISITVSVLNGEYLTSLLRNLITEAWVSKTSIYLSILQNPEHFNIQAYPKNVKDAVAADFLAFTNEIRLQHGSDYDYLLGLLESVRAHMFSADLSIQLPKLSVVMAQLDEKRNEASARYLPWLNDF